jgi:hypothetical protein
MTANTNNEITAILLYVNNKNQNRLLEKHNRLLGRTNILFNIINW